MKFQVTINNETKRGLRNMFTGLALETIRKCPKPKGEHKSPLNIQTHSQYLQRQYAKAGFLERQRVMDNIKYLMAKVDDEYWQPDPARFATQLMLLINMGKEVKDGELKAP